MKRCSNPRCTLPPSADTNTMCGCGTAFPIGLGWDHVAALKRDGWETDAREGYKVGSYFRPPERGPSKAEHKRVIDELQGRITAQAAVIVGKDAEIEALRDRIATITSGKLR